MRSIFVSYRRGDSPGFAGRLCDRLVDAFGSKYVFRDVDSLRGAEDFEKALNRRLLTCAVMLAVIGKSWAGALNEKGERRLNDPDDWVRREIEEGLRRGIAVMPVLVGGATLPNESELPVSLRPLLRRQTVELRDGRAWDADVSLLINDVHGLLSEGRRSWQDWLRERWKAVAGVSMVALLAVAGAITAHRQRQEHPQADSEPMFDLVLDERETCFRHDPSANVTYAEFGFRLKPLIRDPSRVTHAFLGILKAFDGGSVPEGADAGQLACEPPVCLGVKLSDDPERPIILRGGDDGTLTRLAVDVPAHVNRVLVYGRYYQREGASNTRCQVDPTAPYIKGSQLPRLNRVDAQGSVVGETCDGAEETRVIPVEARTQRYCLRN